jgi:GT2 family glycosyltransferase
LDDLEAVELRLDFGLGFVGHHAVRATAERGEAALFVRLFKPVTAIQLLRGVQLPSTGAPPRITLERVRQSQLWRRRLLEQFCLLRKALGRTHSASPHDRPRRLWGWKGLQAFPVSLPAVGDSSYALHRRVTQTRSCARPSEPLRDWLVLVDCRSAQPSNECLDALTAAAEFAGARLDRFRGGSLNAVLEKPGEPARWILLIEPDVVLDQDCVAAFAEAASSEKPAVLYSDSDFGDQDGRRVSPELRTSFSIERLKSQDWLGGVLALRADALRIAQGAADLSTYELGQTVAKAFGPDAFGHIPRILYSRHSRGPRVRAVPHSAKWSGSATVIIPTRDKADLLERCVESIFAHPAPQVLQVIIHDNGSREAAALALLERYAARDNIHVVRDRGPFNFSRINNEAAAIAGGELLVFLNNDTEVVSPDWLETLGEVAADPSVGCVGPLLLHPNGTVQHAGLVTGPGGIAAHVHAGLDPDTADPAVPIVRRDVSAVTGACMAIEKSKFMRAGGFDAEGLPVAFNDVDLCLRLERQGLRIVFVPEAKLVHVGSASRDDDDFTTGSDRFRAEYRLMRERWGDRLDVDPFFPQQLRLTADGAQLRLA